MTAPFARRKPTDYHTRKDVNCRTPTVLHPQFSPEVYLEGATTRFDRLSREHQGPRAILNALERLAGGYGSDCDRVRQDLAIAEAQLRDYQARLGKPFTLDNYLSELTALRDQLKAGLSSSAHNAEKDKEPSVSELAERIKTLKSAHSVEATPQRAGQRHSIYEEPVTARVRRRQESNSASNHVIEPAVTPEHEEDRPTVSRHVSLGASTAMFHKRIALERQEANDGHSPV